MIKNHGVKLLLTSLLLLAACSSSSDLRDKIVLNPNVCLMDLATKTLDCKRPIDDSKNLVCFTPQDTKLILSKCKGEK